MRVKNDNHQVSIIANEKGEDDLTTSRPPISNDIDIFRILAGNEDRTTVMVRNIPNKFKQKTLLEMINEYHLGQYDYFYLPMDLKVSSLK